MQTCVGEERSHRSFERFHDWFLKKVLNGMFVDIDNVEVDEYDDLQERDTERDIRRRPFQLVSTRDGKKWNLNSIMRLFLLDFNG